MKEGIHPNYVEATVSCACGSTFQTGSTKPVIKLEICSSCHPFFTGRQKFVDTAGRVERFQKRFANAAEPVAKKVKPAKQVIKGQTKALSKKAVKVMSSAPLVVPKKPGAPVPGGAKSSAKPGTSAAKPAAPAKAAH